MNESDVDVIVCWPKSMDFPLWRDFIKHHTQYFNRIFIAFTETNQGVDYSDFVVKSLDKAQFTFLYPETGAGQDWRNEAVNMALKESKANWIWFTEQDCLITDPSFWPIVRLSLQNYDAIGYKDGATRMHPSNLWVKREFINKTDRDFGVVPDRLDHFARFYTQLRLSGAKMKFMEEGKFFYHMNGLSHNLSLVQRGEEVTYKPEEFQDYLRLSLEVKPADKRYTKMAEEYLNEA